MAIAKVDEAVRLQAVEIFYDPLDMFRQIAKKSDVKKSELPKDSNQDLTSLLHGEGYAAEKSDAIPASACPFMPGENRE